MKNTHKEAENILVQQMVFAATENQKEISDDKKGLFCAQKL